MEDRAAAIREKYGKKMKPASVICSILIIIYGGLSIGGLGTISRPLELILPIYYVIFGLFVLSAELGVRCVLDNFQFIEGFTGRGIFYIFVATLSLRGTGLIQVVASCLLFVIGCAYLCCYCGLKPERQDFKLPENPVSGLLDKAVEKSSKAVSGAVEKGVKQALTSS